MSYEGYEEFICKNKHYYTVDAMNFVHGIGTIKCPHCGADPKFQCSVDVTNGCYEDEPWTMDGPKTEVGFEDIPHEDHYGNKYFTKLAHYEPVLNTDRWGEVETIREDED